MKIKITLFALLSSVLLFSQNFLEVQLPRPDKLSPFFLGSLNKSTIHYGVTPPNYNGKVILFNHGYMDLNQIQFLFDNSFYQKTYDEGYQAVFVATTRGGGIWVNGELLAESIDIITDKFDVAQVYIIAHSNGGKATEAAMFCHNKKDKVAKAFALGTPFWGTYLADVSQMPLLNWAWNLTGLNEGAKTSTTYYCRDVVRPYIDNHVNNDPDKFVILGTSGFLSGSNILTAPLLAVTGGLLFSIDGANDGVAPYKSTLRPGAEYVFRKNDPRAMIDHLDVSLGKYSWSYIKEYIETNSVQNKSYRKTNYQSNSITESDYYILYSDNEYDNIVFDKGSKFAVAEIFHENRSAQFRVLDKRNKIDGSLKRISNNSHSTIIPIKNDKVKIKSDSRYIAFIKQRNTTKITLENLKRNHHPLLKVDILSSDNHFKISSDIEVRGVITKTGLIKGLSEEGESEIIYFNKKGDSYYFDTTGMEEGVYSLFLNVESKDNFKRSIVSGFVIGDVKSALEPPTEEDRIVAPIIDDSVHITPSSVKDYAALYVKYNPSVDNIEVKIYDVTGKRIKNFSMPSDQRQQYDISSELQILSGGIYIMKVNDLKTIKFIKQ